MGQDIIETTVGQLVVERPGRARVFERLGIDYCCGGKKPLRQAIAEKKLAADNVLAELSRESDEPIGNVLGADRNWQTASLTDLCDHIEQTHHAYLRDELPRLEFLTHKVASRHGEHTPALAEIYRVFLQFKEELTSHMMKEEQVLFPMCRQLDKLQRPATAHFASINTPIAVMIREHDDAGEALAKFRALTNDYTPPLDVCNTYRAMFHSLEQLEQDMHQHVHKENNVLFPRAAQLEAILSR